MTEKETNNSPDKGKPEGLLYVLYWILGIAVVIIISVFCIYFYQFHTSLSVQQGDWGAFGDFIGGLLNPILSFLALMALLLTIRLQSIELEATREELKRSATAQENSEKALQKQSKIQNRQQFESTFFSLLNQHNQILERLCIPKPRGSGGVQVREISDIRLVSMNILNNDKTSLEKAKSELEKKNDICGHYYRILYQLLKFIATNIPGGNIGVSFYAKDIQSLPLTENEKMYSNIIRSFLNHDTVQVLAVNCFCTSEDSTYWRYKLLLERYEFLEHMPFSVSEKVNKVLTATKSFYECSAFGKSELT